VQASDLGDHLVLRFAGPRVALDEQGTRRMSEELLALAGGPGSGRVLVDFANVAYLNAATLGLLVLLHKRLQARGRRLVVCNLAPPLYEVFEVANLHRLLDLRRQADGTQVAPPHGPGSAAARPAAPASPTVSAGSGPDRSPPGWAAATRSTS
jgi:anti-anti-sigma factor